MSKEFLSFLFAGVTKNRQDLFHQKVELRTRYATVILEDLYQPQNASAVLRTCDCFGIQDVHIIENKHKWQTHPNVEKGSTKWLTTHRYKDGSNSSLRCSEHVKSVGYKLVALTPYAKTTLSEVPITSKLAFAFGSERDGLSPELLEASDYQIQIPMYGFTESFNISVAAAICLYSYREKLKNSELKWQLEEGEKLEVMIAWCRQTVRHYKNFERQFRLDQGENL